MSELWPVAIFLMFLSLGYFGGIVLASYSSDIAWAFKRHILRRPEPEVPVMTMPPTAWGIRKKDAS